MRRVPDDGVLVAAGDLSEREIRRMLAAWKVEREAHAQAEREMWGRFVGLVRAAGKVGLDAREASALAGVPRREWQASLQRAGDVATRVESAPWQPRMTWTREAVIEAIRAWHTAHGAAPSAAAWRHARDGHPSQTTVINLFGSWRAGITAAGFEPRRPGRSHRGF